MGRSPSVVRGVDAFAVFAVVVDTVPDGKELRFCLVSREIRIFAFFPFPEKALDLFMKIYELVDAY